MAKFVENFANHFTEEYQLQILAATLRSRVVIHRIHTVLDPKFFPNTHHHNIAVAGLAHFKKYSVQPTKADVLQGLMAAGKLDEDCKEVMDEVYAGRIGSPEALIDRVIEYAQIMAFARATLAASIDIERGDLTKVVDRFKDAQKLTAGADGKWYEFGKVPYDEIRRMLATRILPLGNTHMTRAFDGGPRRGHLYVCVGGQKTGKSTSLINLGYWHANALPTLDAPTGQNVLYMSHEIESPYILDRLTDRYAGPAIIHKRHDLRRYIEESDRRAGILKRGRIFVRSYPTGSCTASMMRIHMDELASEGIDCDAACVDFADLMKPEKNLSDALEAQASVYQDLRAVAIERRCAVHTASQGGRQVHGKETMGLEDVAGTIKKMGIMDGGIGIVRPPELRAQGLIRWIIMGMRNIPDGLTIECQDLRDRAAIEPIRVFEIGQVPKATPKVEGGTSGGASSRRVRINEAMERRKENSSGQEN